MQMKDSYYYIGLNEQSGLSNKRVLIDNNVLGGLYSFYESTMLNKTLPNDKNKIFLEKLAESRDVELSMVLALLERSGFRSSSNGYREEGRLDAGTIRETVQVFTLTNYAADNPEKYYEWEKQPERFSNSVEDIEENAYETIEDAKALPLIFWPSYTLSMLLRYEYSRKDKICDYLELISQRGYISAFELIVSSIFFKGRKFIRGKESQKDLPFNYLRDLLKIGKEDADKSIRSAAWDMSYLYLLCNQDFFNEGRDVIVVTADRAMGALGKDIFLLYPIFQKIISENLQLDAVKLSDQEINLLKTIYGDVDALKDFIDSCKSHREFNKVFCNRPPIEEEIESIRNFSDEMEKKLGLKHLSFDVDDIIPHRPSWPSPSIITCCLDTLYEAFKSNSDIGLPSEINEEHFIGFCLVSAELYSYCCNLTTEEEYYQALGQMKAFDPDDKYLADVIDVLGGVYFNLGPGSNAGFLKGEYSLSDLIELDVEQKFPCAFNALVQYWKTQVAYSDFVRCLFAFLNYSLRV